MLRSAGAALPPPTSKHASHIETERHTQDTQRDTHAHRGHTDMLRSAGAALPPPTHQSGRFSHSSSHAPISTERHTHKTERETHTHRHTDMPRSAGAALPPPTSKRTFLT